MSSYISRTCRTIAVLSAFGLIIYYDHAWHPANVIHEVLVGVCGVAIFLGFGPQIIAAHVRQAIATEVAAATDRIMAEMQTQLNAVHERLDTVAEEAGQVARRSRVEGIRDGALRARMGRDPMTDTDPHLKVVGLKD